MKIITTDKKEGLFVFLLMSLIFLLSGSAMITPHIDCHAEMGGSFRTVDMSLSLSSNKEYPFIYYLALPHGSPDPSVEKILAYGNGMDTTGLTNGTVVRGRWIASSNYNNQLFSLMGGENVEIVSNETGFIDGYRYDIYVIAVDFDGVCSPITKTEDIMAQPFDAMSADHRTFTIRTLEEFQNIQRLADLFVETKGVHGSLDFLTSKDFTYVLETDIDLRKHENWIPIGNTDVNPKFIFRGSFDGQGHTLRNLFMDKDTGRDSQSYMIQGLFGKTEDATIRNLIIEEANIKVAGDFGKKPCTIGTLVGESTGGSIDHISIKNASVQAYGPDAGYGYVGGLVGKSINTHLYDITLQSLKLTTSKCTTKDNIFYAESTGGVVGFYQASENNMLLKNITVDGSIHTAEQPAVYTGGIAGFIDLFGQQKNVLHAEKLNSNCTITGGSYTGGLVGIVNVYDDLANDDPTDETATFDMCRFTGHVTGESNTGGIFGMIQSIADKKVVIKNTETLGYIANRNGSTQSGNIGGLAGILSGCTVENCFSKGPAINIVQKNVSTGGLVGKASNAAFYNCISNRDVSGMENTGGFAGCLQNDVKVINCYATGEITGHTITGGFIGLASGRILKNNAVHSIMFYKCYATGNVNSKKDQTGGFAGSLVYAAAENCYASGQVNTVGSETGGFCGRVTNMSRISNAYATGNVISLGNSTGGFTGILNSTSNIEYSFSSGNVSGSHETGGFLGVISAYGTPNTLTGCLALNQCIDAPDVEDIHRFAGRLNHEGINDCYAYSGTAVTAGQKLCHMIPNAYGADGADVNNQNIKNILTHLGWDQNIWDYANIDDQNTDTLQLPRYLIFGGGD